MLGKVLVELRYWEQSSAIGLGEDREDLNLISFWIFYKQRRESLW